MQAKIVGVAAAIGAAMVFTPNAEAGVTAAYIGVMDHNICVTNCKNADKEGGPNIEGQLNFDSPGFLSWAGSPQPYVMASVNTAGDTSFGGVGLEWRWEFLDGWALQPGVGYIVHDGELENPYADGTPEAADWAEEHVQFGSRDLFRTSLGLTRELPGPWEVEVLFEHLSHGQILGEGRNQGTDELGVRLGYRFGE